MSFSLVVIGKPGGCKSTTVAKFQYEFSKIGLAAADKPDYVSDRLLLESAILEDVHWGHPELYKYRPEDGALVGEHSVLLDGTKPSGQKKIHITDSSLLNAIHDEMAKQMLFHDNPRGEIFEYATGPEKEMGDGILDQDGDGLVRRFRRLLEGRQLANKVFIFEVDASLDERIRRNGERVDGMDNMTFRTYFGDGGELKLSGIPKFAELGVDFHYIDNDHHDIETFLRDVEEYNASLIRSLAEGQMGKRGKEQFRP